MDTFFSSSGLTQLGARLLSSISIALLMSVYGFHSKALSTSGAVAAFITGVLTFFSGAHFGIVLIAFFVSSSRITKINQRKKKKLDVEFKEGGQRTWVQVLANSLTATVLCVAYFWLIGEPRPLSRKFWLSTFLQCAFIGHYACCNADTWASELGVLSSTPPVLITTFQKVPPGTNGGISLAGTGASIAGGIFIGTTYYLVFFGSDLVTSSEVPQWPVILFGALAGFLGSLLDSLFGATLQFSGFSQRLGAVVNFPDSVPGDQIKHISGWNVLDNHQVNFISSLLTALVMGYIGWTFF